MFYKYLIPLLAAAGVAFSIYSVRMSSQTVLAPQTATSPTQTSLQSEAPFGAYIAGSGLIEASTENIAIGTPVSGIIAKRFVNVGSAVKAGDPLFVLDDRGQAAEQTVRRTALQEREAHVKEAEAALSDVRNQLALLESVTDRRAVSVEEMDKRRFAVSLADAKLATARAEVKSSEAMLKAIEVETERLTVRAPISGKILQVNIQPGAFAA